MSEQPQESNMDPLKILNEYLDSLNLTEKKSIKIQCRSCCGRGYENFIYRPFIAPKETSFTREDK